MYCMIPFAVPSMPAPYTTTSTMGRQDIVGQESRMEVFWHESWLSSLSDSDNQRKTREAKYSKVGSRQQTEDGG